MEEQWSKAKQGKKQSKEKKKKKKKQLLRMPEGLDSYPDDPATNPDVR